MATIDAKTAALKKSKAEEFASACPSRVIELAMEDLEWAEKSDKYRIDMGVWHEAHVGTCSVCLAGSVMASRLEAYMGHDYEPYDFENATAKRLAAVNLFRIGDITNALGLLEAEAGPTFVKEWKMTEYWEAPDEFKAQMHAMAAMLKSHGL